MPRTIIDTDMVSEIYKAQNPIVSANARAYVARYDRLTFMSVTASEMLFGLYAKDARSQLMRAKAFLKANEELVPTSEDYWLVAEINGALRRAGTPIDEADALIAACTLNRGMSLATGNTKHYQFVINAGFPLNLEDWRVASVIS